MINPNEQLPHTSHEESESAKGDFAFAWGISEWSNSHTEEFYRAINRHSGSDGVLHLSPILQGGELLVWLRACSHAVNKRRNDIAGYYEPSDFIQSALDFGSPKYKTAIQNVLRAYIQYKKVLPVFTDPSSASGLDYNAVFQFCEDLGVDPGRVAVENSVRRELLRRMTNPTQVAKQALTLTSKLEFDAIAQSILRYWEASAAIGRYEGVLEVHDGVPYIDYLKEHVFNFENEAVYMRALRSGIHGAALEQIQRF